MRVSCHSSSYAISASNKHFSAASLLSSLECRHRGEEVVAEIDQKILSPPRSSEWIQNLKRPELQVQYLCIYTKRTTRTEAVGNK